MGNGKDNEVIYRRIRISAEVFTGFDAGVAALDELLIGEKIGSNEQVVVLGDLRESSTHDFVLLHLQYTSELWKNSRKIYFSSCTCLGTQRDEPTSSCSFRCH